MLLALSLDGILHLEVVENAVTGVDFHQFIEGLLLQMYEFPLPNLGLVIERKGTEGTRHDPQPIPKYCQGSVVMLAEVRLMLGNSC